MGAGCQREFHDASVEFVGTAEKGPGVRLWPAKRGRVKAKGGSIRRGLLFSTATIPGPDHNADPDDQRTRIALCA